MSDRRMQLELRDKIDLKAENERLWALHGPMLRFVNKAIEICFDGCDYDGGQMQEDLHKFGLLEQQAMHEPCGEGCMCADLGADFPAECYRIIPAFLEALQGEGE